MPLWALLIPIAAAVLLAAALLVPVGVALAIACLAALMGTVIASVHHAEVVAHRVGEPFGTLVLSLAITIIEVALIVSMMLANPVGSAALARDTVFATVMIICNGVVGLCLLVGGLKHREQAFHVEGANAALATLIALTALTLVLPGFTTSSPGPTYTRPQLIFAAIMSLVLWSTFLFVQTVRHRDYFLPVDHPDDARVHAAPPSNRLAIASFLMLIVALVAVVGLAKVLSPRIEAAMDAAGAPKSALGIAIALLVLLPETWAAARAAQANRLQTSLNLAFGSALASIGLTIPVVAATAVVRGVALPLGLDSKELVLLVLSFALASITLVSGRTHVMQGVVHLVIFAAFVFFALVP
jgi:Ca2+:H+ antiporter